MRKFRSLGKLLAVVLTLGMIVCCMSACGSANETETEEPAAEEETEEAEAEPVEQQDLIVFAAASMTETLTELGDDYMADHPEINIVYTFDSSGTLKTQIEEGADCDIFISAAQKQMNALDATQDAENNPDGLDFVDPETRFDILENTVVLVVPEGNPKGIESFDDMKAGLEDGSITMAMGNEDVPVGQYTQKILAFYNLDEAALASAGSITYGTNVKEVTTQVTEGTVDCGVIYATDAYSAGLDPVDTATEEMCGKTIYPAAVLKGTSDKEAAQAFLDYLQEDHAKEVFEKVGFIPLT